MKKQKIIWVLTDDKVGTNTQSIGFAGNLAKLGNYKIGTKKIEYSTLVKLPNFLRSVDLTGVDRKKSDSLTAPYPDVLISAGRRLSTVSYYIKKKSKGKTFNIHITDPHLSFKKFNLLLLPRHDGFFKDKKNMITTFGSLNKISKEKIEIETEKWKEKLQKYQSPRIALLIGGDTKSTKFSPELFLKFGEVITKIVKNMNGSLFVTTSPRTNNECTENLKKSLKCSHYFYDWKKEDKSKNPYFAYIGLSDFIIVTGDSISMCSEVCSVGKPVYIYYSKPEIPKKHYKFCSELIEAGYAKKFDFQLEKLQEGEYKILNETERVTRLVYSILYQFEVGQ